MIGRITPMQQNRAKTAVFRKVMAKLSELYPEGIREASARLEHAAGSVHCSSTNFDTLNCRSLALLNDALDKVIHAKGNQ